MYRLKNQIQEYSWGSVSAIPDLLGTPKTGQPQAEMWVGAHPSAPSELVDLSTGLDDFISNYPAAVGEQQDGSLPFLLKVLAAAEPLSLQVHPSLEQAREGFENENAAGIALNDPSRNYKDANHKPEMILALSEFVALCGFREPAQVASDITQLLEVTDAYSEQLLAVLAGPDALRQAFLQLVTGGDEARNFVRKLVEGARNNPNKPNADTISFITAVYGDDPGVAAALLLNRLDLRPGEALYLGAGNIHAYLHGLGIEVMATSDNVLRGGLTSKHVDIAQLSRIVNFTAASPTLVEPKIWEVAGNRLAWYQPPISDFSILDIEFSQGGSCGKSIDLAIGPALALQLVGETNLSVDSAQIALPKSQNSLTTSRGDSIFLPSGYKVVVCSSFEQGRLVVALSGGQLEDNAIQVSEK